MSESTELTEDAERVACIAGACAAPAPGGGRATPILKNKNCVEYLAFPLLSNLQR